MQNKKKNKVLFSSIVIVMVMVLFCSCEKNKEDVKILKSDSWFHEFYIKDDKVFIKCEITIQNCGDKDRYINLLANMEEDKNNGLLKSSIVSGYDKKGNDKFFIPAKSKKNWEVLFIGDFAGKAVKQNRNLPMIDVVVIKE